MKKLNTKMCPNCNRSLTLDNFYKASSKLDGLQTLCKHCFNEKYSKVKNHTTQLTNISVTDDSKPHMLYRNLPTNTPFTVKDILKLHKIPYTDKHRSRIQGLLYELISENLITKTGKLHTGDITYLKKSTPTKHLTFEPRTCIKCHEPLMISDLAINPNAKICSKCSTQLTTTTTTQPMKLNDDVERLTTILHNELTLLNSKLNGNHDIVNRLDIMNTHLSNIQQQNKTLIKIFAANCRTLPPSINPNDLS